MNKTSHIHSAARIGLLALLALVAVVSAARAQVNITTPTAPVLEGDGQGLCMASSVSDNPSGDFGFLNTTNYIGSMNTFMELHLPDRVESVVRTPLDLSNNNPNGLQSSFGDFIGAVPSCGSGGCGFFINDPVTSFGSRLRGFFNVTPDLAGVPIHFGLYTDDAVSLTFYDKSNNLYPVMVRPPQLGAPTWRLTETVTFEQPGLYPLEILYVEITEHAALELSFFVGDFEDFARPANQAPVVTLDDAGFELLAPARFFQTITGAPSFVDLDRCQQCDRQFVNQPGNNGCGAGYYCNEAALCAPCDTAFFCGPECSPCGGTTPHCINVNEDRFCVQCRDDADCPAGFSCDPDTHECNECNVDADCPRGQVCEDNSCVVCDTDAACAGSSCNCCPLTADGRPTTCAVLPEGGPPVCVQCLTNDDCPTGVCDVLVGQCVDELRENQRPSCCGADCVQCPDAFPHCLPSAFGTACAECRNDLDCQAGAFCLSGLCQPCTRDKHCGPRCTACAGDTPFCLDGQTAASSECVACIDDGQCRSGRCNPDTHTCDPAPDCVITCGVTTPHCYGDSCVECFADTHCPCGGTCDLDSNTCVTSCKSNSDCLGTEHCRHKVAGEGKECSLGPMPDDVTCGGTVYTGCSAGGGQAAGAAALLLLLLLRRRGTALLAFLALALAAGEARAQEEGRFDAQVFRPSAAPRDLVMVEKSEVMGHLSPSVGLYTDFGLDPLVLFSPATGQTVEAVAARMQVTALAGIGLLDWMDIKLAVPFVAWQSSDNLRFLGTEGEVETTTIGDIRLSGRVAVPWLNRRGETSRGFGMAVAGDVNLPSGNVEAFAGDGVLTGGATVIADYRFDAGAIVSANAGVWLRPERQLAGLQVGDMGSFGLAGEMYVIQRWGLSVLGEVYGYPSLHELPSGDRNIPAEWLLALRWQNKSGLTWTFGGSFGAACSFGAPALRLFSGLTWIPKRSREQEQINRILLEDAADPDHDGIKDEVDRCPDRPGPAANDGCPDVDSDGDGVADRLDGCPELDGRDGRDGCPPAYIKGDEIVILDRVHFATDKDVILPESRPVLEAVARVLKTHPDITLVRIEGHTDIRASDAYNLDLSQRRVSSVRAYLIEQGIAPQRLEAKGFGHTQPLYDDSACDRPDEELDEECLFLTSKNRRVVFRILRRLPSEQWTPNATGLPDVPR